MHYDERGFASAADGTKLFYGSRGTGAALVLLDGIGCDGWAWVHIQPHLALHYRVVHCHYRGHGRSGAPVDPTAADIETLSDDVLRVLDKAQIERAVLLTHSMGSQVALELYRTHPERVRALVLACGSYGRITHTFHGTDILSRVLPTLITNTRKYGALARALWGRLPPALSYRVASWLREIDGATLRPEDFRLYVEHLSDIELDVYLTMLQHAGEHSAEDMLGSIRVPTLVIAAERDTFTPRDVTKHMAEQIPGAVYRELRGASHAAPSEQPELINACIDDFLAKLT
ncbi:MAG TPA: alpha/beta fold hydrolase [Polyangiales bacterium]